MRLSTNTELIVLGVLILYIAFTPGFPIVRQFLSTSVGKAAGLALIVYVWKYVSEPVALLLTVNYVRCAGMREGMVVSPPQSYCPAGYNLQNNICKKEGFPDKPATSCLDPALPKWDEVAEKCISADSSPTPTPGAVTTTPSVMTPTMPTPPVTKQTFVGSAYEGAGVQPSEKKGVVENFAPF